MRTVLNCLVAALFVLVPTLVSAQTTTSLPEANQTTIITAVVSEQAVITMPSSIAFNVNNVNLNASTTASISVNHIVTASDAKQLRISVQANAASFTPPVSGATTWKASQVSWGAGSWTNATGSAGTLSSSAYTVVALGAANVGSLFTASIPFTLASNSGVTQSGNHTLIVTWKVESL